MSDSDIWYNHQIEKKRYLTAKCLNPECNNEFTYTYRKHGGGKHKKYCSTQCCKRAYYLVNFKGYEPIKERSVKYPGRTSEEMKSAKQAYSRRKKLKKYGINDDIFYSELKRQNNFCLGCSSSIDKTTARADHSHTTQKFRGLLCNSCNWALGHVKDNQKTLYNLIAYLDRDYSKKYIYLIGSLRNEAIPHFGMELRSLGFEVFDEWYGAGKIADDSWQEYSKIRGHNYKEALKEIGARHVFNFDRSHIEMADIGVLMMPAGKSGFMELGYMSGLGKPTFILDPRDPDRYDVMTQFADAGVFTSRDELFEVLSAFK